MLGFQFLASKHFSIHHQKSSTVSPRHANIGNPKI